jgi:hypothetical protein
MLRALALPLVAIAFLSAACRPPEDPATRYRRFAAAARGGDADTAWALLATASQKQLEARSKELKAGGPTGGADLRAQELLLGDLARTAPKVKAAKVARADGDRATVDVELEGGGHGQVEMQREQDGWRVVLPGG